MGFTHTIKLGDGPKMINLDEPILVMMPSGEFIRIPVGATIHVTEKWLKAALEDGQ